MGGPGTTSLKWRATAPHRGSSTPDLVSSDAIIFERYFYVLIIKDTNAALENESSETYLCKPAVRSQSRSAGSVSISGLQRWESIEQVTIIAKTRSSWVTSYSSLYYASRFAHSPAYAPGLSLRQPGTACTISFVHPINGLSLFISVCLLIQLYWNAGPHGIPLPCPVGPGKFKLTDFQEVNCPPPLYIISRIPPSPLAYLLCLVI